MAKKCIVCEDPAEFKIRDTSDFYCKLCAQENFAELNLLVTLEEEAQRLKNLISEMEESLEQTNLPGQN